MASPSPPIPFAEPPWLSGYPSPYYQETHRKFQKACRSFFEEHLTPFTMEWERSGDVPENLYQTFARYNMLIPNLASPLPVEWLNRLGLQDILGTPVTEWDSLHTGIYLDEAARSGLTGPISSLTAGHAFAIPPIIKFGSKVLQEKFLPDLLSGKRRACIAITEPTAGSDVANIATAAEKSADGKYYILNGQKKWITNGIWPDYATMAVRTGGSGAKGLSLIICPLKGYPGVTMHRIKVLGQVSAGTTFIDLDDVQVPVENLIGEEGMGMKYIMTNFNHERLTICCLVTRQARIAVSSALGYVMKRQAFEKALIEQPVVRHKLAKAAAEVEMMTAWVEQILYQMTLFSKVEADVKLGGLTALCKAKAGMVLDDCARTAIVLFGGNGFTSSGQGEIARLLYKEVPGARVPGGSEDVMLDLAIRQLVKHYKKAAENLGGKRAGAKL